MTRPVAVPDYTHATPPTPAEVAQLTPKPDEPTWARLDLTSHLDGTHVPQVPELLARTDGAHLLYRGRVHSFHGESESGKSWVALAEAATQLTAGERVLMLDFESDAHTTVGRLLRMGVTPEAIAARFDYRRPEVDPQVVAVEQPSWSELLGERYALVILDGVTEALAVFAVSSKDNDEVTGWIRAVPRRLAAATGGAVVLVDHVTKDADSRGRFALGGQAKMAALDGAAYVVEVVDPLGVGLMGRVALRVAKDRPGGVRPHAGAWRKSDRTQEAALVVIDSRDDGITAVTVEPPRSEQQLDTGDGTPGKFRPTVLMARVSQALEKANACMTRNGIANAVIGKRQYILEAIDVLVEEGHLLADGPNLQGGRPSLRLVKPYREGDAETVLPPGTGRGVPGADGVPVPVPLSSTGERGNGSTPPVPGSSGTPGNGSGTGRAEATS